MTDPTDRSAFWQGFREGLPFVLTIVPFALLFGVVATEAGLDIVQALVMSVLVVAGASQFAAAQMIADNAPVLVVIVTALAVNLRMAMYSAALTPHLGRATLGQRALISYLMVDQCYALAAQEYDRRPDRPVPQKVGYILGSALAVCPAWVAMTLVGAVFGGAIPPAFALDFAVPVTFLAMIAPMLRSLPHLVAAFTAIVVALLCAGLPHGTGLFPAAIAGMLAGAETERRLAPRRARLQEGKA
ncbi:AzlC family ABC transporter permease [Frigidibacter sp. MR17.24]|uniref:AzlC family ABC transporter permease n=1 Tax=Frigidibacter sp. MR17.24 TaxID=3127345 RepID=UPI003012AA67